MYRIDEDRKQEYRLILPATLDAHFPLLKYMFWTRKYRVEILDNTEGIVDTGLKYANNEMCYPFILMVGQVISDIRSSGYPAEKTRVLMPTAGDACRGACFIGLMQNALNKAHLEEAKVLTLNVRHVEKQLSMEKGLDMAIRGLFGLYYGDILMLLSNQVRPYEKTQGETDRLWQKWIELISEDLKSGKNLSLRKMYRKFDEICEDFRKIERIEGTKQRIGIVGEFYAKYCHLGNWNIIQYLEQHGCEAHVNGLSWYAVYYIDTHMPQKNGPERWAFSFARKLLVKAQNHMIQSLQSHGFYTLPNLDTIRSESEKYVSEHFVIGDGWLMGGEVIGHIKHDCRKVLCVAPFGCMPNACAGRGLYPYLQRCFPEASITSVENDASGSKGNYYNRVQMLVDYKG